MKQAITTAPSIVVDASGLICPMPLLKAKQALARMTSGEVVKVIATDPSSSRDITAFVSLTEHILLESVASGDRYIYLIQKGRTA